MRIAYLSIAFCAVLFCGATVASEPKIQGTNVTKPIPLILDKNEGEQRVIRGWSGHPDPGETFILKVDPKNGGSSHLVFLTATIRPGGAIETHRYPSADEILFLQNGIARVHLGDTIREVHAGATVFIPANTWISVDNIGSDAINLVAVFSAPGFEDFMRAVSVRKGEKNVLLTNAENEAIEKKYSDVVIYNEP